MPKSLRLAALSSRTIAFYLCFLSIVSSAQGQSSANKPENLELLNGLRILFWEKPGNPNVLVKLRIHSGSAFDLNGKSGQMALLGDIGQERRDQETPHRGRHR